MGDQVYNTDFLPQMEKFRRHLFGSMPHSPALPYEDVHSLAHERPRGHGPDDASRYVLPPGVKILPCYEDINGEWVPYPVEDSNR
jgi:hypothetical protein